VVYTGGKTKDKIMYWLSKVNGEKSLEITCDDLKAKISNDDMTYILAYFGEITSDLFNKAHEPYSIHDDLIEFVHNQDEECAKEFGIVGNGEMLFTKHNKNGAIFNGRKDDEKSLLKFVKPLLLPSSIFEF
jgi:hypothetical protein